MCRGKTRADLKSLRKQIVNKAWITRVKVGKNSEGRQGPGRTDVGGYADGGMEVGGVVVYGVWSDCQYVNKQTVLIPPWESTYTI
jgi:hypothetical protein